MIAHKSYLLKDFEVSTKSHDNTKLIVLLMMRDSAAFIVTACAHKSRLDWLKVYRQKPFDLPLNPFSFDDKQRLFQTHKAHLERLCCSLWQYNNHY